MKRGSNMSNSKVQFEPIKLSGQTTHDTAKATLTAHINDGILTLSIEYKRQTDKNKYRLVLRDRTIDNDFIKVFESVDDLYATCFAKKENYSI